jgi:hypothetical protein
MVLLTDVGSVGLGEDGADRCGDHLGVAFGDLGQHVGAQIRLHDHHEQ